MSDTPRTDAIDYRAPDTASDLEYDWRDIYLLMLNHARTLERELAMTERHLERAHGAEADCARLVRELSVAKLAVETWKREAKDWREVMHGTNEELVAAQKDSERLDWVAANLVEPKWDGTIGRPAYWQMIGPYRHALARMRGDNIRAAIDAAMAKEKAP